jgi:aspartate aminotransferase
LLNILKKHKVFLISDEAYEHVLYEGMHQSIMSLVDQETELAHRIISVFTMSKSYAMTGLRLGYIHSKNKELMKNMKKVVLYTANGVNSITQYGGIAAIYGPQDDRLHMISVFEKNRDILFDAVNKSRVLSCSFRPKGAFYIFAKINENWEGYESRKDDKAFVNYLIDKGRCGATPGSIFGPTGKAYVRFSYACATEMVEKAAAFIQSL